MSVGSSVGDNFGFPFAVSITYHYTEIPEPATALTLAAALAGLGIVRKLAYPL